MTLSDIKKRVRVHLSDENATSVKDKAITEIANSVLRFLWQKIKSRNPDWTQKSASLSTVTSSDTVTTGFPTDYGSPVRLEYTSDKVPLRKWRWPEDDASITASKPYEYRIEKGKIVFRQPADAVYSMTLWYEAIVTLLSADADIHGLPEFFDEVLVQRTALMMGAKNINPALFKEIENSMLHEMGTAVREVKLSGIPVVAETVYDGRTS